MGELRLFLHFLNRELNRSIGLDIPENKYETEVKTLLLTTTVPLYTNYANILEGGYLDSNFYTELIKLEILYFYAEGENLPQYLETREEKYFFDKERYSHLANFDPINFDIKPKIVRDFSMTTVLKNEISLIQTSGNDNFKILKTHKGNEGYWKIIELIDSHSGKEAMTISLVQKLFSNSTKRKLDSSLINKAGKLLAILYFHLTTNKLGADIPTGIKNVSYFDYLSKNFPKYDVSLLSTCLFSCGYGVDNLTTEQTIRFRSTNEHKFCSYRITQIFSVMFMLLKRDQWQANNEELKGKMHALIAECKLNTTEKLLLEHLPSRLERLIEKLDKKVFGFKNYLKAEEEMIKTILILTATKKESKGVLNESKKYFTVDPEVAIYGGHVANYLGMLNNYKIYHAQCEAGSGGPSGSQAVATDLITHLNPDKILMPGIAFGLQEKEKGQKIGDILVSTKIHPYEMQRVGKNEIISRGDIVPASPTLLSVLRSLELIWEKSNMHFGIIMSGEKLVDNKKFVSDLKKNQPEAIGGEMEGAGLYAAAYRKKVDWIVFKSIVDWGMGKTDDAQSHSSSLASEVLFEALKILTK